ncbi:hypothetical protein HCB18_26935 [Salinispora arenicola]|nr:hypothetical protein [Salinispora arenicola]
MSSEAHFTLSDDWRQRINQWALQQRLGADLPVSSLWRWFEDTELRGADRAVQNLVIAVFALRDERAWVHHGVEIDPPGLEHIDRDDKLRARELPSVQEFERAWYAPSTCARRRPTRCTRRATSNGSRTRYAAGPPQPRTTSPRWCGA